MYGTRLEQKRENGMFAGSHLQRGRKLRLCRLGGNKGYCAWEEIKAILYCAWEEIRPGYLCCGSAAILFFIILEGLPEWTELYADWTGRVHCLVCVQHDRHPLLAPCYKQRLLSALFPYLTLFSVSHPYRAVLFVLFPLSRLQSVLFVLFLLSHL